MPRYLLILVFALLLTGAIAVGTRSSAALSSNPTPASTLDPANFVPVVDNPYFPLPTGRTLVYTGIKDGQTQVDTVTVMSDTKVIEGITATVVRDVSTHDSTVLERTFDWYAQDRQGNVWYLGEDTTAYLSNGK